MLPKSARYSFKKGYPRNIFHTSLFTVRYQKNDSALHAAVVVGKRVDPLATGRNKIKRQFTKLLEEKVNRNNNLDVVFIIKHEILNANSDTISKQLDDALSKLT